MRARLLLYLLAAVAIAAVGLGKPPDTPIRRIPNNYQLDPIFDRMMKRQAEEGCTK
jgi:hypothetical protein